MFFRNDDKKDPRSKSGVRTVPLLPLRDIIVFPHMVVPLFVGREKSIAALEALVRSVHATFEAYVKLNKRIPPEMLMSVATIDDPARLADTIVAHLSLKLNDKQAILEEQSAARRLEKLYELMQGEIEILQVEKKIRTRVKKQMEKTQKEYYLNEQMQAIQKELGERDEFKSELQELEEKIKNKKMSKEAIAKAKKELRKLKMMSPMSAEATVVRNYIDWIITLPWYEYTKDKLDINEAEKILNDDHYGLKKPKERILEYLAVQAMVEKMKGPILCFVGPPGVGKTSLGKSIAKALGRKFVRISLGGVRDEAEDRALHLLHHRLHGEVLEDALLGLLQPVVVVEYLAVQARSEEHTSELQSRLHLVCRLLLEKKKKQKYGVTRGA